MDIDTAVNTYLFGKPYINSSSNVMCFCIHGVHSVVPSTEGNIAIAYAVSKGYSCDAITTATCTQSPHEGKYGTTRFYIDVFPIV